MCLLSDQIEIWIISVYNMHLNMYFLKLKVKLNSLLNNRKLLNLIYIHLICVRNIGNFILNLASLALIQFSFCILHIFVECHYILF